MRWEPWITWLNANSAAVVAVAAVVGTAVAAVYAFFTLLLWRATTRQADSMERMYEASHRPWLRLRMSELEESSPQGDIVLEGMVENRGNVVADVVRWTATASVEKRKEVWVENVDSPAASGMGFTFEDQPLVTETVSDPVGKSLPPDGSLGLRFIIKAGPDTCDPIKIKAVLLYAGVSDRIYRTTVDANRSGVSLIQALHMT